MDTVIVFIFSLFIGSFYNVVAIRGLHGMSIVWPPSHCPVCKHKLSPRDLIPVLSYIMLKGRCRYCRAKISFIYPFGELLTAVTILFSYLVSGFGLDFVIYATAGSAIVISIISELIEGKLFRYVLIKIYIVLLTLSFFRINFLSYIVVSAGTFFLSYLVFYLGGTRKAAELSLLVAILSLSIGSDPKWIGLSIITGTILAGLIFNRKEKNKTYFAFITWIGLMFFYLLSIIFQ